MDEPESEEWEATRAQTQMATRFVGDKDDYLAAKSTAIGRLVGEDQHELFVSCDPAQAMQQQFEHLHPEFIAVHDIGTSSSRQLLAGVAAASGRKLQKLAIRRQGQGTPLATLEFIECPTGDGGVLRMYHSQIDSDTATRQSLARALLAHSRLAVMMVGNLPAHALGAALAPWREAIGVGPWLNRQLLLLPLASGAALASQGSQLVRGSGVTVRTTPQVTRPADAWSFISGSWNRLREQLAADGVALAPLGDAKPVKVVVPAQPAAPAAPVETGLPLLHASDLLTLRPMPPIAAPRSAAVRVPSAPSAQPASPARSTNLAHAGDERLARYVRHLSALNGMRACAVFDVQDGRVLAGERVGTDDKLAPLAELAERGAALLADATHATQGVGLDDNDQPPSELSLVLTRHFMLLRPLPDEPQHCLLAVFDKGIANLTLARLQIQRLDPSIASEPQEDHDLPTQLL